MSRAWEQDRAEGTDKRGLKRQAMKELLDLGMEDCEGRGGSSPVWPGV